MKGDAGTPIALVGLCYEGGRRHTYSISWSVFNGYIGNLNTDKVKFSVSHSALLKLLNNNTCQISKRE